MRITTEFPVRLIEPDPCKVRVRLAYDTQAPLEIVTTIRASLLVAGTDDIDWTFDRGLYLRSLDGTAGIGDVRLSRRRDELMMRMSGLDENDEPMDGLMALPAGPVELFLLRTLRLVPYGAERVDVDRELSLLLGGRS